MSESILEIRGLYKSFGSTRANRNIDFTLKKGEIKGLIGENGSGKSTLLSQIAGVYRYDAGQMLLRGAPYAPQSPLDANRGKIAMVTQELGVIDTLPVGINVFLGRLDGFAKRGVVNMGRLNQAAAQVFERWDLPAVPPGAVVSGMMVEQRKLIELARAMSVEPDILLLDEITQSLSLNNRNKLYALIEKLKALGKSVIVITHDIEEMLKISDSVTVLRDGEVVGEVDAAHTTVDEIRCMMVGREISGDYYRADTAPDYDGEVVLTVENAAVPGQVEDLSFQVHRGEILGFCGLSDSGIHAVGKIAFGLSKLSRGRVLLGADEIKSAPDALGRNMAYVPKDRDSEALMVHASIGDNCALPSLNQLKGPLGFLSPARQKKLAGETVEKLNVKCTGINQSIDALSGGNRQKINLGRWLAKDPKVLILDCPTRGVDVGVKGYIYDLMKQAKARGIAVILISDELTEVLGMADRLIVMKDGHAARTVERGGGFTERAVIGDMI